MLADLLRVVSRRPGRLALILLAQEHLEHLQRKLRVLAPERLGLLADDDPPFEHRAALEQIEVEFSILRPLGAELVDRRSLLGHERFERSGDGHRPS